MKKIYIYLQTKIMKQELLLMMLPLPLYVFAQDAPDTARLPYHPMLKEGKTWLYKDHHFEEKIDDEGDVYDYDEYETDYNFVLKGDTVINGERAFKMYRESENGSSKYVYAWIEQDKRVYRIHEGTTEKVLYYDFNLKRDNLWYDNISGDKLFLHHVDTLNVNKQSYNRYHFYTYNWPSEVFNWVEGIGSLDQGILFNGYTEILPCICDYITFEKCFEDGKQIFPQMNIPDAILSIPLKRKDNEAIYDLQGRKVTTPQKNGLYIKDGKKFIFR